MKTNLQPLSLSHLQEFHLTKNGYSLVPNSKFLIKYLTDSIYHVSKLIEITYLDYSKCKNFIKLKRGNYEHWKNINDVEFIAKV